MVAAWLVAAVPGDSPVIRTPLAQAAFTATVTIRRGVAIGRGHKPPKGSVHLRTAQLTDSVGQPVPAVITDFE